MFTCTYFDKEFAFEPMTIREYLQMMVLRDENPEEFKTFIKGLLYTHFGFLPRKPLAEFLLVHLVGKSVNEQVPINLDKIIPTKIDNIIKDFGKFKVEFTNPELFSDDNAAIFVASCIDKIYVADQVLTIDELSDEELSTVFSVIDEHVISEVKMHFSQPSMVLPLNDGSVLTGFSEIYECL